MIIGLFWGLCTVAVATEPLTVWHSYRGAEEQAIEEAAQRWSAQTGVQVEAVSFPFDALGKKIETAIPRGNGPDVFIGAHDSIGKWAQMDVIQTVDLRAEGYRDGLLNALKWEGESYGFPLAYKSLVLFYNPELVDHVPLTTDDLLEQARAHTHGDSYGLAYQASSSYFFAPWMYGFGADVFDEAGQPLVGQPEQIAAFDFVRSIASGDGSVVPGQPTAQLVSFLYNQGKAAFVISGPWFLGEVERPIAAAPLPIVSATGLPARPYLTVEAAFVAQNARHPQAGVFAQWLSEGEAALIRQEVGQQAVAWAAVTSDEPMLRTLSEQAKFAVPMPSNPDFLMISDAQSRALRGLLRGDLTPEMAAESVSTNYRTLTAPPPSPVSPWPYFVLMLLAFAGTAAWTLSPLLEAEERRRVWRHRWDYAWIGPAGVVMAALVMVPFFTGASVSLFAHYQGEWSFVGLAHFWNIILARDWAITSPMSFWFTLVVTVLWTVTNLVFHVGIGVFLALILREPWIRLRALWRVLLIIPWAVPNYITALIWKGMFHAQYGAINALISVIVSEHVEYNWFGSFASAFSANLITNTWLGFPFMMVITLGALQSIPRDLEEAAEVDGAGWFFRFRHVVWPLLAPALMPAIILGSVWTFNMFNVIYLVSAGEPDGSSEILISEAYRWAFTRGNRYGYAAAYAVLIFGVLLIYSRGANHLAGRKVL